MGNVDKYLKRIEYLANILRLSKDFVQNLLNNRRTSGSILPQIKKKNSIRNNKHNEILVLGCFIVNRSAFNREAVIVLGHSFKPCRKLQIVADKNFRSLLPYMNRRSQVFQKWNIQSPHKSNSIHFNN